jgi:hypothetical protein
MPRIRTVKPEMWQDEALGAVSVHARLLFVGLITQADDDGRLRGAPSLIGGSVFPYDGFQARKIDGWLDELTERSLIVRYEWGDQRFIWIKNWSRHQRINRKTDSVLPPPPTHQHLSERLGSAHDKLRAGSTPEGKGTEGSMEGNGSPAAVPRSVVGRAEPPNEAAA